MLGNKKCFGEINKKCENEKKYLRFPVFLRYLVSKLEIKFHRAYVRQGRSTKNERFFEKALLSVKKGKGENYGRICKCLLDIFGENVFNDKVMQERLPKNVYKKLKKTIAEGGDLDLQTADMIAHEMKEWAIEKGATHYTHWFQPLTGVTAEKHDSFISAPVPRRKSTHELLRKRADQR